MSTPSTRSQATANARGYTAPSGRDRRVDVDGGTDESVLARSEELDGNYTWDEITKDFNEETGKGVCTTTG